MESSGGVSLGHGFSSSNNRGWVEESDEQSTWGVRRKEIQGRQDESAWAGATLSASRQRESRLEEPSWQIHRIPLCTGRNCSF